MAGKLSGSRRISLISPLIDVVLGAFLALFVLFSVYVLLMGSPEPIRFLPGIELPAAIAGQNYVFTFPVAGGKGERRFEIVGELPPELALEEGSGTIYGNVTHSGVQGGRRWSFKATVRDDSGRDERDVGLGVFPGAVPYDSERAVLQLFPVEGRLPTGRVGSAYSVAFHAVGGIEPYRWSSQGLPGGLRLTGGVLRGIPVEGGSFTGTVQVEHSPGSFRYRDRAYSWAGGRAKGIFSLRIYGPLRVSEEFPVGRVGEAYAGSLLTDGLLAEERVEWQDVPSGLEVSGGGVVLAGAPTEAGTFSPGYRVRGFDDRELAAGRAEIVIFPRMERGLGPAVLQVWLGEPTRQSIPLRGLSEPLSFVVEGELPPGLSVESGYLTGTATRAGLSVVQMTATDAAGVSVSGQITIRVGPRF